MLELSDRSTDTKLWTPANIVTVARICGVPLFVVVMLGPWPDFLSFWPDAWLWKPWLATAVFIILAATDGLDGYLARSRGEVTNFGKFVDPLADKILTTAALLVLIELGVLPSWPVLIILSREFIVAGIRMLAAAEGLVIAASWYGKAKTVTQIIAIALFLVKDSPLLVNGLSDELWVGLYVFAWFMMVVAVVLTIVSMLDYFAKARELLGFTSRPRGRAAAVEEEIETEQEIDLPCDEESLSEFASQVLDLARASGRTVATAESLTGGLIASLLTSVPGSSDVVAGGIVSYTNEVKASVLGVSRERLDSVGAVDEQVALQMAYGAKSQVGSSVAVAVTGIAGPGGAEPGKPVGTVCFAVVDDNIEFTATKRFDGDRAEVRAKTARYALELLSRTMSPAE